MARVEEILDFWFGSPKSLDYGKERSFWFTKNPEFDRELGDRFLLDYEQAARGELDYLQDSPLGCLTLVLLLDQFGRNMFRGTPKACDRCQGAVCCSRCSRKGVGSGFITRTTLVYLFAL
jgi:uncharacterized protein (DUF924 family)